MNRYIRRVFNAYALALLASVLFVPWHGRPDEPWAALPVLRYAPLWLPPRTLGYAFSLDVGRLFLQVLSLTAVLAAAVVSLWGRE